MTGVPAHKTTMPEWLDGCARAADSDGEILGLYEVVAGDDLNGERLGRAWAIAAGPWQAIREVCEHGADPLGTPAEELDAEGCDELLCRLVALHEAQVGLLVSERAGAPERGLLTAAAEDWSPRVVAAEAWADGDREMDAPPERDGRSEAALSSEIYEACGIYPAVRYDLTRDDTAAAECRRLGGERVAVACGADAHGALAALLEQIGGDDE